MPPLLWLILGLLAVFFVRSYLAVLGNRVNISIARHELIRETKIARMQYLEEVARRQGETIEIIDEGEMDEFDVELEGPADASVMSEPIGEPMRQAA